MSNIESATNARCVFTYACPSGDRPMALTVNDNDAASINFPATGAWSTWITTEEAIFSLPAGSNKIRITATADSGDANIDKMDITMGTSIVTPEPTLTPGPTAEGGLFVETYVPSVNVDLWNEYISELDYVVETGGNGGSRTITHPILVRQGTTYDGKGE